MINWTKEEIGFPYTDQWSVICFGLRSIWGLIVLFVDHWILVISWNKEAIGFPFFDCFACLFFWGGVAHEQLWSIELWN